MASLDDDEYNDHNELKNDDEDDRGVLTAASTTDVENGVFSVVFDELKEPGLIVLKVSEKKKSMRFNSIIIIKISLNSSKIIIKVGRTGPSHRTVLKLSADGSALEWRAKRKNARRARVPLEAVSRVTTGQVSRNFARLNASYFYRHANADPDAEARSVSLGTLFNTLLLCLHMF
jgi:hypothetical protein